MAPPDTPPPASDDAPTSPRPTDHPDLVTSWNWRIALVVAAATVGAVVVITLLIRDPDPPPLSDEFSYDVSRYARVDPELVAYEQVARFDTPCEAVKAVAAGPDDRVYVGGDTSVLVFSADGKLETTIACDIVPRCLAVAPDGTLYVGSRRQVTVFGVDGKKQAEWTPPTPKTSLTSLALAGDHLYLADAGERAVWRYRTNGERVARLADKDPAKHAPGLIIPSPYFDIAMAPDGLLRVVNPGRHQVEAYTEDGQMELSWGRASFKIEGFIGCCNPAHIAILASGDFVTSEKGMVRVKIYDSQGEFTCIVAGPATLGDDASARDVAVDSRGRILVLDPSTRSVRLFRKKVTSKESDE